MKMIKTIFALTLAALTVSCTNMIDDGKTANIRNPEKAYITVSVSNQEGSPARTILPAIEITDLELSGSRDGGSSITLATASSYSKMQGKEIELQTGNWTFELTASVSGTSYRGSTSQTIESGVINPISFILEPADGTETGSLNFSLSFTGQEALVYDVKLKIDNTDIPAASQQFTKNGTFTYEDTGISAGTHSLQLDFYCTEDEEVVLNTFQSIFRIERGIITSESVEDFNLNEVYSIKHEKYDSSSDTFDPATYKMIGKFSRKSSSYTLPVLENSSMEFSGWYKDEAFTEGPVTQITPTSNLEDITLYAKWLVTASGNISTPFDYNFTFDLKTQKDSPARTILPEQETTFKLTTAVTKNGTAIPLTIEDGKTFLDDKEVTWTANLWNDGKLAESITVTPDAATGKIYLTVPALTFQDTYILKITANYCALSFDANYLIKCEPKNPMLTVPLTLEAIEAGAVITFSNKASGSVTYKVNGGEPQTIESNSSEEITLTSVGDKVQFFGDNATYTGTSNSNSSISCTKECYVYGNIMSLIKSTDFENEKTLTESYTFYQLFMYNSNIKNMNLLLPATTLTDFCYSRMFWGCTKLTSAPELPATSLTRYCYASMFQSCKFTTAPELPATSLAEYCYNQMFYDCTNLEEIPALPATSLAKSCYFNMFNGCTGLTTAPELKATRLAESCCKSMFEGCINLTRAPELKATTLEKTCYTGMFSDCTSLTTAPELPATELEDSCYYSMFYGCTSLTNAPELPATTLTKSCYGSMFRGCTSLTNAPALPATTLADSCYLLMFDGCTSLTNAPTLPATTLADSCYYSMFSDCTNLTTAPALPATTLADSCYRLMFDGCTNLTTAPELPATELADSCYYSMFSGCTSLTTAPELPATTLADSCYRQMFNGCTSLNSVTCLATDISANNCTRDWLKEVAATGTFTKAPGMTGWTSGLSGIPSGWTVEGTGSGTTSISAADLTETNYETVTNITLDSEEGITKLIELAKKIGTENGKTFEGKTITLDSNITLSSGDSFETEFLGTFDGNGKTIYGLSEVDSLFMQVGSESNPNAVIQNLTVSGSSTHGGIAKVLYGTIQDCVSYVTVDNTETTYTSGVICAGICYLTKENSVIKNCVNKGEIKARGGYVAGICGWCPSKCLIDSCRNEGKITVTEATWYIGGISGYCNATIINCVNTGDIIAEECEYVGGIAGYFDRSSTEVANCYNTGSVKGKTDVGGIVGILKDGTIKNCYNRSSVSGPSASTGYVLGTLTSGTVAHNYYYKPESSLGIGGTSTDDTSKTEEFTTASALLENLNSWVNDSSNKPIPEGIVGSATFKEWEIPLGSDGYPTFKEN